MTTDTGKPVTRETQIVYLTEWAARYRCSLQLNGQVGFGRDCVGVLKGDTYLDYEDQWEIWKPEDAYHKHDCVAVLGHGDESLEQLYRWVKWLDENRYGVEVVYRQPTSDIDLAFHGISTPKLVKLQPPGPAPEAADEDADFADEWDDEESNRHQDRVEAGLEEP